MISIEITRCCGTCFFWEPEGGNDFKERCKCRFREPYCRLDNKPRRVESGRGCLGWKPREQPGFKMSNTGPEGECVERGGIFMIEWQICQADDKFLVGKMDPESRSFDPICTCDFYNQAELVCAALKHFIYAKNYSSRGVAGCPGATGKFLRRTVMMALPG